jgi:hypothetical protein
MGVATGTAREQDKDWGEGWEQDGEGRWYEAGGGAGKSESEYEADESGGESGGESGDERGGMRVAMRVAMRRTCSRNFEGIWRLARSPVLSSNPALIAKECPPIE